MHITPVAVFFPGNLAPGFIPGLKYRYFMALSVGNRDKKMVKTTFTSFVIALICTVLMVLAQPHILKP